MEFILAVVFVTGLFFLIKKIRGPLPPKPPVTGGGGTIGEGEGTGGDEIKITPINAE
jgi:hypothetical protein